MRKWLKAGLIVVFAFSAVLLMLFLMLAQANKQGLLTARAALENAKDKVSSGASTISAAPAADSPSRADDQSYVETLARLGRQNLSLRRAKASPVTDRASRKLFDEALWKDAANKLKKYDEILKALRDAVRGAHKSPGFRVTPKNARSVSEGMVVLLAELCALSAESAARAGHLEAALDSLSTVFRLAASVPAVGGVQAACWHEGLQSAMDLASRGLLSDAQVRDITAMAAETLPTRDACVEGIANEADLLGLLYAEPSLLIDPPSEGRSWDEALAWQLLTSSATEPLRVGEASFILEDMSQAMALADRPYYEIAGALRTLNQRRHSPVSFHPLMTGSYGAGLLTRQATCEAELDLLRLGSGVEAFRAEHGAYPASLDAIASSFGGQVLLDPFTGQPYRYRVSGGGYVLYSLGPNQIDDGGSGDDVVWRGQQRSSASPKAHDATKT